MKPVTEYDFEIQAILKQQMEIATELKELMQKRAEELCPFKVGDILVSKEGKRAKVVAIIPGYFSEWDNGYKVIISYFLKNGKESANRHNMYDYDKWEKEKKENEQP